MNEDAMFAVFWACVAAVLITVAICAYQYNVKVDTACIQSGGETTREGCARRKP